MMTTLYEWIDRNILSLGRDIRLSYLPPLMVYVAYGISGLTGIVGTFFVKDYLGLSASFLAALGFWAGIPWALKMPIGHTVDLLWRWKSLLVGAGAALLAVSLGIMAALIGNREAMTAILPAEVWFVLSTLLAPVGYVVQDAVADAMTVEAVPRVDDQGRPFDEQRRKLMHTTMQTLGRVAIIGGTVLLLGIALIVLPGPAFLVIPAGLAILATEFAWAKIWIDKVRAIVRFSSNANSPRAKSQDGIPGAPGGSSPSNAPAPNAGARAAWYATPANPVRAADTCRRKRRSRSIFRRESRKARASVSPAKARRD